MLIAKLVSTRSTCNSRATGAVLVKDKQILATGYNGSMPGAPHCIDQVMPDGSPYCYRRAMKVPDVDKYNYCRASHAEANAIAQAARHGVSVKGATLYVTLEPCYICMKLLATANIEKIYFELGYESITARGYRETITSQRSRDNFWTKEALNEGGFKEYKQLEVSKETMSFILPDLTGKTSQRRLMLKKPSVANLPENPLLVLLQDASHTSINQLWAAEFISNVNISGSGIAVFDAGRIFGGDSNYYYLGNFNINNAGFIKAVVKVTHFAGQPYSIFGNRKEFSLSLSGEFNSPVMELGGFIIGEPKLKMLLRLTSKAELPGTPPFPEPHRVGALDQD